MLYMLTIYFKLNINIFPAFQKKILTLLLSDKIFGWIERLKTKRGKRKKDRIDDGWHLRFTHLLTVK